MEKHSTFEISKELSSHYTKTGQIKKKCKFVTSQDFHMFLSDYAKLLECQSSDSWNANQIREQELTAV